MKYGDKQVRYAVIEKDGHLREVKKTFYESTNGVDHQTKQPAPLVKIKNDGSTSNAIILNDTGTNGSYIVKNSSNYVSNFGWIDTNEVSIPSKETIATNGQNSDKNTNIVNGTNGQFVVIDWSNCKAQELGSAFNGAKCIKSIPSEWPNTNFTSLYRTLAGITIDKIPNWTNTNSVTDARELFNGTTINGDLKIDSMTTNLASVTTVKKMLNNCTINDYSYTDGDYKFYYLYKALKEKVSDSNATQCFGGQENNYVYAVRFKYTDPSSTTASVIPPDLMYIPQAWGGFAHRAYTNLLLNDTDFTTADITLTDKFIEWQLDDKYYTLREDSGKYYINTSRAFYDSTIAVVELECDYTDDDGINTHGHFYTILPYYVKSTTWKGLPSSWEDELKEVEYTIKIHLYTAYPDSSNPPHYDSNDKVVLDDNGNIDTDYFECFLKSDASYRGSDGVYTRQGLTPVVYSYDITQCTITGNPLPQGTNEIPWEVYDVTGRRVDNCKNPPDNYVVSLSDGTNTYTFGAGTVLVTSAVIPIYSIPEGMCTDSDGNVITDIPDGDYYIDITAYKNSESCNVVSQVTVENWTQYDDTCSVVFDTDTENLTWTVRVMKGETDVTESMIENKSMTVWIYDANNTLIVPGFYLPSNTYKLDDKNVIKIQNITENPGTYRLEVAQVKSKRGWYIPPTGSVAATETLTIPDSGAVNATLTSVDLNGIILDNTDAANFEFYLDNELNESQLHVGFMSLNTKPEGSVSSWTYTLIGLGIPSGIISKTQEVIKLLIDDVVVEKTLWKYTINKTYNSTKYNAFGIGFDAWAVQKVSMLISNTASNDICFGITTNSYFQANCLNTGSTSIDGWLNFTSVGSPYRV